MCGVAVVRFTLDALTGAFAVLLLFALLRFVVNVALGDSMVWPNGADLLIVAGVGAVVATARAVRR